MHKNVSCQIHDFEFSTRNPWLLTNQSCCGHEAQSDWSSFGGIYILSLDNDVN